MANQKRETINELLVETFSRIGIPEFLHSDQVRNFESHLLKETCHSLGIKKTHTTSYHSQGNAMVEGSNRTILQMLRCYVEGNGDWEKYLYLVLFAYRTSKHSVTGISPFHLMYSRDSPSVVQLLPQTGHDPTSYEKFLRRKMISIQKFVEDQLIYGRHKNARESITTHTVLDLKFHSCYIYKEDC